MKLRLRFSIIILLIALFVLFTALGMQLYSYIAAFLCVVAVIWSYRAVSLPMQTIYNGMNLLKSQDFASRLLSVGQKEADEVVELYNKMITHLKTERLHNLEQENFLAALIEASPMGIAICNLDGEIIRSNPAFNRMKTKQLLDELETLGDNSQITLRLDSNQVLRCSRRYFMDRGFQRNFYLIERLTDEIVKAETQVFHKIVRTIGHEVNNTLGGVVSVLETLADIHSDDADIFDALKSCTQSCLALGSFVRGYSDVVKLPEAVLQKVDLNSVVKDLYPFLKEMSPDNIAIKLISEDDNSYATIDAMLINRVIINAVKNAIESIGSSKLGTIVLRVAENKLRIEDDGAGISDEVSKQLFTPFFSTKNPDRGLGLMLIADILRKHNATFSLSTSDGITALDIKFKKK